MAAKGKSWLGELWRPLAALLLWVLGMVPLIAAPPLLPSLAETRIGGLTTYPADFIQAPSLLTIESHRACAPPLYDLASGCSVAANRTAGALGRQGEAAIEAATGLSKNTESFVVNGRTRIPDFIRARDPVTGLPTSVIEAKNVQYQALTRQLRDYRDLVGAGGRVDVALPPGARVTKPLQDAFDNPNNPLFRMDLPK